MFAAGISFFVILTFSISSAREKDYLRQPIRRLPNYILPRIYDIKIAPTLDVALEKFTFSGEVKINVDLRKSTNVILMNSHKLKILSVDVVYKGQVIPSSYNLMTEIQILEIITQRKLRRNRELILKIKFSGRQNDEMFGFYGIRYEYGNMKWLATTQSEPNGARMIFPCFDEPRFKSVFIISIARAANSSASYQYSVTSMPLNSTSSPDPSVNNYVWDRYQPSPRMSTKSVSFAVGEYSSCIGYELQILCTANTPVDTWYPYDIALAALRFMKNYFGKPNHLPLLYLIGMPDIGFSATQRIEFRGQRQPSLLFNDQINSASDLEAAAKTLTHEIAHRWFGDHVTPEWWDSLWLDRGFATYFSYYLLDEISPTWRIQEKFVVEVVQEALAIDGGLKQQRPLNASVETFANIQEKFEKITYLKAAAILRMFENIMTHASFKNATNQVMLARGNIDGLINPSDLYDAMDEEMRIGGRILPNNLLISTAMKAYIEQSGYPYLLAFAQHRNDFSEIIVIQKPYKPRFALGDKTEKLWPIPLSFATQSDADFSSTKPAFWIHKKETYLEQVVRRNEWFIFNINQTSYYRVNYNFLNWMALIDQLKSNHKLIPPLNRAQLLDDACTFSMDRNLPFGVSIKLLTYLQNEEDIIPWHSALRQFKNLIDRYEGTKHVAKLRKFAARMIRNMYDQIGFEKNSTLSHPFKVFRSSLVLAACNWGVEGALKTARYIYSKAGDIQSIHPDVREAVLCVAIKDDPTTLTWNRLWETYQKTIRDVERRLILRSLGCSQNEVLLREYLYKLIGDNKIHTADIIPGMESVTASYKGISVSLNFIREVLHYMSPMNDNTFPMLLALLNDLKLKINSREHLKQLKALMLKVEKRDDSRFAEMKILVEDAIKSARFIIEVVDETIPALSGALVSGYMPNKFQWQTESSSEGSVLSEVKPQPTSEEPVITPKKVNEANGTFSLIFNFLSTVPLWWIPGGL